MLWTVSEIHGYAIVATDGEIGTVSDVLFDDVTWSVRWLVVDTGHWLSGRKVLLPTTALGVLNEGAREFKVELTQKQVRDSPDVDTDRPVSRQVETNIFNYYGWTPYWGNGLVTDSYGFIHGTAPFPATLQEFKNERDYASRLHDNDDLHLRSISVMSHYHIHALDGEIGHVKDFLLDDVDWGIHFLVVDTSNWWMGKDVLILPKSVQEIDWINQMISLGVNRQKVKESPAYTARMTLDQVYEKRFHDYYGYPDLRPTDPIVGGRWDEVMPRAD